MNTFAIISHADLDAMLADFGEDIDWGGALIPAVVDDEGLGEDERREGVLVRVRTLRCREADLDAAGVSVPKPGRAIVLDSVDWTVARSLVEDGLVTVQHFREDS